MKYRNLNRGRIWPNDRKQQDSQPDYEGTLNVKGEEFWISAWKKSDDKGAAAQSLSFSVRPRGRNVVEQPKDYIVDPLNRPVNHAS
jgi:hypothetical protein